VIIINNLQSNPNLNSYNVHNLQKTIFPIDGLLKLNLRGMETTFL